MSYTEEAIKKAIEGGWKLDGMLCVSGDEVNLSKNGNIYKYFLDPLFWQALGKALGWNNWICENGKHSYRGEMRYSAYREKKYGYTEAFWFPKKENDRLTANKNRPMYAEGKFCRNDGCNIGLTYFIHTWFYHWHKFIDHLASGKTPEEFFKNLLTNQK